MKGFYTKKSHEEIHQNSFTKEPCEECSLYKKCNTSKMSTVGAGEKGILLVFDMPSEEEDSTGEAFTGAPEAFLASKLERYGIDLETDCWRTFALCCRTPNGKAPSEKSIKCCKHRLDATIEELKPKHIWLCGESAIKSFFNKRSFERSVTLWHGLTAKDKSTNAWVSGLYSPQKMVNFERDKFLQASFEKDLKEVISTLKRKSPTFIDFEKRVKLVTDFDFLYDLLENYANRQIKTFVNLDYETSGLKPYKASHKIWTASIKPNNSDYSYSFPISYPYWAEEQERKVKVLFRKVLQNKNLFFVIQNSKFEEVWTKIILKTPIVNIYWCTMNAAHLIKTDSWAYTGEKFQAYLHFGVDEYGAEAKKYMKRIDPKTGLNCLDKMPLNKLLLYNGLDTAIDDEIFLIQQKILKEKLPKVHKAFKTLIMPGLSSFSDVQINGICIDNDFYEEKKKGLAKDISLLEHKLQTSEEALIFKKQYKKSININSSQDLQKLFFEVLKLKKGRKTKTGYAVDEKVLQKLKHPFAKRILKIRKKKKIKDTYIAQYQRNNIEGKIHPNFDFIPETIRSSSSDPNFQNTPRRDEEAKIATRQGIIPSEGNMLICIDFGSQEVRIIACVSKDKVLIDYLVQNNDPHADSARDLFYLKNIKKVPDKIRFFAKNQFVFPEFYGSYYISTAKNLWITCKNLEVTKNITVQQHLVNEGIICKDSKKITTLQEFNKTTKITQQLADFIEYVKIVEMDFWEKFQGVKEWQEKEIRNYLKRGYIEQITGFRRTGYLRKNEIINTPIQGPAFHCLLWSMNELIKIMKKERMKSKIIGQIHDEIVGDICPKEKNYYLKTAIDIMENKIREKYSWIIVPLKPEIELTKVNESWYFKEKVNL